MQLTNKVALITGASSGIGEALAKQLAAQGMGLILAARSTDKLDALRASLPQPHTHKVVSLDLNDNASIDACLQSLNGIDIDLLVNNAGISQRGRVADIELDVYDKVMQTNFFGTVRLTVGLLPMLRSRKGKIVNVASVAGKVGGVGMAGYAASKHALIGFMDSLRAEEAQQGLSVLNVCPGFVQTQISVNGLDEHGQKYGKMVRPIANGITAEACARIITTAIEKDKVEIYPGKGLSRWAPLIKRLSHRLFFRLSATTNPRES